MMKKAAESADGVDEKKLLLPAYVLVPGTNTSGGAVDRGARWSDGW